MLVTIEKLLPILVVIMLGYGLKRTKILDDADGSKLLKLVFYIGVPALILLTIPTAHLERSTLFLGLLVPVIMLTTLAAATLLRKGLIHNIPAKTYGVLVTGAIVMNTGFLMPIVSQLYGANGLARLLIIDTCNALFVFSIAYGIAVHYGGKNHHLGYVGKKLLISPPLWALVCALLLRSQGLAISGMAHNILSVIATITPPIILLGLGLKLSFSFVRPQLLATGLTLRLLLGGMIGIAFVKILGLEGLTASVVILASVAPIGFNSIVFAELEKLDTTYAAAQVTASLIVATIVIPIVAMLVS